MSVATDTTNLENVVGADRQASETGFQPLIVVRGRGIRRSDGIVPIRAACAVNDVEQHPPTVIPA